MKNKKRKILFVASDNNKHSGAFKSMARLARHLQDDFNFDITIIVPCEGNGIDLLEKHHLHYIYCETYDWVVPFKEINSSKWEKKSGDFKKNEHLIQSVDNLIKQINPDIIHINTSWCYLFGAEGIKLGYHVVWHIREFLEEDQDMHFIDQRYAIGVLKKADKVVCVSKAIYNKYHDLGLSNLVVVYNGIDLKDYSKCNRTKFTKPLKIKFVGTVGQSKGQFQIVEWFGELMREKIISPTDFEINLIGRCSGYSLDVINRIKEKYKMSECVVISGPIDDPKEIYQDSNMVIVNSKSEAFGRTTIEGMMNNCLVLASDTGGTKEIIDDGENGLLFKYNDFESFKKKIEFVISHADECENISLNGYKKATEAFNSLSNAQNIVNIYKSILKE